MIAPPTPPAFNLYAATGAALTSVLGPAYTGHWSDCLEAVEVPASLAGWSAGQALGAAFILWLANAGDAVDDFAAAMADGGGDLDEVSVSGRRFSVTVPGENVGDWPDLSPVVLSDAMSAVGVILTNPAVAALVVDLRLREDAGAGSGLVIRYANPGREIVASYGSPPIESAALATERWLSGSAIRAVSVALNEVFALQDTGAAPAAPQTEQPTPQPEQPAERFGAVGPATEPGQ